jgi:hypothetical protein
MSSAWLAEDDVALRRGDASAALGHFRHAWRIVQDSARMIGRERLLIKTMWNGRGIRGDWGYTTGSGACVRGNRHARGRVGQHLLEHI